jgi:hypothetical protein
MAEHPPKALQKGTRVHTKLPPGHAAWHPQSQTYHNCHSCLCRTHQSSGHHNHHPDSGCGKDTCCARGHLPGDAWSIAGRAPAPYQQPHWGKDSRGKGAVSVKLCPACLMPWVPSSELNPKDKTLAEGMTQIVKHCLASTRPRVQTLAPQRKQNKKPCP